MSVYNIKLLSQLIKDSLPRSNINLIAEVRQPKISNGHMYLNLKDGGGVIGSIIWKSNVTDNVKKLKDGDKIDVNGKLDYYGGNGRLSFVINKVNEIKGEGELHQLYQQLKIKYENKGYFLDGNKIKLPLVIKKILLLTSENGDAIKDFYHCIEHNNLILDNDFINVSVQGIDCPKSICKILDSSEIYDNQYDMIVITRGGGSFEDLFGFCKEELIESAFNCTLPILSAVGHKQDTTLLDYVADCVAPTPSLAAQFIVDHNKKYIEKLYYMKNKMNEDIKEFILKDINYLFNLERMLADKQDIFKSLCDKMKNNIIMNLHNNLLKLDSYLLKYNLDDNIKLFSNNIELKDYDSVLNSIKNNKDIDILINGKIVNLQSYKLKNV